MSAIRSACVSRRAVFRFSPARIPQWSTYGQATRQNPGGCLISFGVRRTCDPPIASSSRSSIIALTSPLSQFKRPPSSRIRLSFVSYISPAPDGMRARRQRALLPKSTASNPRISGMHDPPRDTQHPILGMYRTALLRPYQICIRLYLISHVAFQDCSTDRQGDANIWPAAHDVAQA
jgi:hypothetical protein